MGKNIFLVFLMVCGMAYAATLQDSYQHFSSLDENQDFLMYWTINDTTKMMDIAISVNNLGWVGIGFSPYTGRMPGSDIVIGWVDSQGTPHLQDRYATGHILPELDTQQDYTLLSGEEKGGKTILKFRRKFVTGDSKDLPIEGGTSRLIWAYNSQDPTSPTSIPVHQKKGSRSLNLFDNIPLADKPPLPNDTMTFDVLANNVTIPTFHTTYWCTAFKIPEINGSGHIIKIGAKIQNKHLGVVHHILVFDCPFDDSYHGFSAACHSKNMPQGLNRCRGATIIGAWASGNEGTEFPAHVGLPIGGSSGTRYLLMETHYDNPNLTPGIVDSSGLTFYYTFQKRQYDAGMLQIGKSVSPNQVIPEGQKKWESVGYCAQDCTQKNLPATGINVVANFLHTHLVGTALKLKHHRNGVELPILAENPHYDFNYQDIMYLKKETKVMPGDQLSLICTYNTESRPNITIGGTATSQEMCLVFLMYYPKQPLATCLSYENNVNYLAYFEELKKAGKTPPFNTFPSQPPYAWSVLERTKIGNSTFLGKLRDLDNAETPMQYCAARGNQLLQDKIPLPISPLIKTLINQHITVSAGTVGSTVSTTASVGSASALSFSMLIVLCMSWIAASLATGY